VHPSEFGEFPARVACPVSKKLLVAQRSVTIPRVQRPLKRKALIGMVPFKGSAASSLQNRDSRQEVQGAGASVGYLSRHTVVR
jgi:hypothetical protein